MTVNKGRTLFDSKTEFSYSPDSRKTLVLTSRLEDISRGYGNSNYSLSVGVAHAHSDLNVQFRSHAGMDSARASAGLEMDYLTSARQTKTLALRAEIDKLKKEIDLLVSYLPLVVSVFPAFRRRHRLLPLFRSRVISSGC